MGLLADGVDKRDRNDAGKFSSCSRGFADFPRRLPVEAIPSRAPSRSLSSSLSLSESPKTYSFSKARPDEGNSKLGSWYSPRVAGEGWKEETYPNGEEAKEEEEEISVKGVDVIREKLISERKFSYFEEKNRCGTPE